MVIQDTQEKIPFDFSFYDVEVKVKKIPTADYTLEGYEDVILIERKASVDEIAGNFTKKKSAWWKEMKRMSEVQYKYILCEFPFQDVLDYPKSSKANRQTKINGVILSNSINKCISNYGIEFIFCDNKKEAEQKAFELLKQCYDNDGDWF